MGYLGVKEQASQMILFNISGFLFMLSLGISAAATANIGKQIGRGNVVLAKRFFAASNHLAAIIFTLVSITFYILRRPYV